MDDRDLVDEFVRIERTPDRVRIRFRELSWRRVDRPRSRWVDARVLPATATEDEARAAATALLQDEEYFRVCRACRQRNAIGRMHDDRICQRCATDHHDVVY